MASVVFGSQEDICSICSVHPEKTRIMQCFDFAGPCNVAAQLKLRAALDPYLADADSCQVISAGCEDVECPTYFSARMSVVEGGRNFVLQCKLVGETAYIDTGEDAWLELDTISFQLARAAARTVGAPVISD